MSLTTYCIQSSVKQTENPEVKPKLEVREERKRKNWNIRLDETFIKLLLVVSSGYGVWVPLQMSAQHQQIIMIFVESPTFTK